MGVHFQHFPHRLTYSLMCWEVFHFVSTLNEKRKTIIHFCQVHRPYQKVSSESSEVKAMENLGNFQLYNFSLAWSCQLKSCHEKRFKQTFYIHGGATRELTTLTKHNFAIVHEKHHISLHIFFSSRNFSSENLCDPTFHPSSSYSLLITRI